MLSSATIIATHRGVSSQSIAPDKGGRRIDQKPISWYINGLTAIFTGKFTYIYYIVGLRNWEKTHIFSAMEKKEWVPVEVVDPETGETHIEERLYNKNGYLTKPPKGVPQNRGAGRKKKIPELDTLLADILGQKDKSGNTAAMLILAAIRKKALAGDVRAAEVLMDRAWGKARQEINVNKTERQFILIGEQKIEF
jgi:hypothetical protein